MLNCLFKFKSVNNFMAMIEQIEFLIIALGGFAAGAINAIAGGGTLISFPILTAVGIPVVQANISSTVSLSPGYLAATFAQLKDLKGQKQRLLLFLPIAAIGGIFGGILLLQTGDKLFRSLVPYLILIASILLALQEPLKKWLNRHQNTEDKADRFSFVILFLIALAAIYGGYFGAGLSVIVLALLALTIYDNLNRLNALKQIIGFSVNMGTAIFFIFSGKVVWPAVFVMGFGAIIGGWAGGKLASKIKPARLRYLVVVIGLIVSVIYFVK
jgi:uncharacterized membrane protein YfcA